MRNNEAYDTYKALKNPKNLDKTEVLEKLELFRIYLEDLCGKISKSTPKENYIIQWIFCHEYNRKDAKNYYKANIFAATGSIKRIISTLKQQEISPVFRRLLIDYVGDMKEFVNYFDKSQNYKWLIGNTFTHITNFYFILAQNVFINGKPSGNEEENLALSSSTPFIIRQSIEYKIKRILGINFIEMNGKPHKTNANIYFKALNNNSYFYKTKKIDFVVLEKIHSWTHFHIHGGYRARPWITETAINYLTELFYSGKTSDAKSLSLYAGIEIEEKELPTLLKCTEDFIKKEIGQNIEIHWLQNLEVAFLR
ncbi:hypothetical protein ACFLSY_10450 [Bacteroidota bacterium]